MNEKYKNFNLIKNVFKYLNFNLMILKYLLNECKYKNKTKIKSIISNIITLFYNKTVQDYLVSKLLCTKKNRYIQIFQVVQNTLKKHFIKLESYLKFFF